MEIRRYYQDKEGRTTEVSRFILNSSELSMASIDRLLYPYEIHPIRTAALAAVNTISAATALSLAITVNLWWLTILLIAILAGSKNIPRAWGECKFKLTSTPKNRDLPSINWDKDFRAVTLTNMYFLDKAEAEKARNEEIVRADRPYGEAERAKELLYNYSLVGGCLEFNQRWYTNAFRWESSKYSHPFGHIVDDCADYVEEDKSDAWRQQADRIVASFYDDAEIGTLCDLLSSDMYDETRKEVTARIRELAQPYVNALLAIRDDARKQHELDERQERQEEADQVSLKRFKNEAQRELADATAKKFLENHN